MKAATLALTLMLLSGCGQKGPLYLPDKNPTVITRPAAPAAPAPASSTPKKDDPDAQTPPQ